MLTHSHESNILKLWLNDCKSSSRTPNTARLSVPRAPAKCRLPNGSGRRSLRPIAVEPVGRVGKKLEVIRAAARLDYPTGDIDRMLAEIEMGYGSGAHP